MNPTEVDITELAKASKSKLGARDKLEDGGGLMLNYRIVWERNVSQTQTQPTIPKKMPRPVT